MTGSHEVCLVLNAMTLKLESGKDPNKQWLAAYVKMHHERKTRDRLTAMGIVNFLPAQMELRTWSDRVKEVEQVLIPMMIFVYVNRIEQIEVLKQPSVIRYVVLRNEHRPAIIPDRQMDRFRFLLEHAEKTVSFSSDLLTEGQLVRVMKGPLAGLEGEVVMVQGKSRVAVQIDHLGYAIVEIEQEMVRPIE